MTYDSIYNIFYVSVCTATLVSYLLTLVGIRSVPLLFLLATVFFAIGLVARRRVRARRAGGHSLK